MPPAINRALLAALALVGCTSGAPSTFSDTASPRDAAAECASPPGSCDAPAPQFERFDSQRGCLAARAALTDVRDTLESRCGRTLGLVDVCAISPAGDVYVGWTGTDETLTATGWFFTDGPSNPRCTAAMCAPPCPGVAIPLTFDCPQDAGRE